MGVSVSKRVENQFAYARLVIQAVENVKPRLLEELTERHEAASAKRIVAALQDVSEQIGRARQDYSEQLSRLTTEEGEDAQRREQVALEQTQLGQALRQARAALAGGFGQTALAVYGVKQVPPTSRDALAQYGKAFLDQLTASPRQATNAFGAETDTAPIRLIVEERLKAFKAAFAALGSETKQTQQQRADRDRLEDRFRQVLVHGAQVIEGTLRLGGLDYVADRIRPTQARALGEEEVDSDTPIPESDPSQG